MPFRTSGHSSESFGELCQEYIANGWYNGVLQKIGKQNKQLIRNTILRQNIFFLTCTPIAFLFGTHLWLFAFWFRLFLVGYRRRVKVIMDHSTTALLLIFVRGEGVSTVHSPSSTVHRPFLMSATALDWPCPKSMFYFINGQQPSIVLLWLLFLARVADIPEINKRNLNRRNGNKGKSNYENVQIFINFEKEFRKTNKQYWP